MGRFLLMFLMIFALSPSWSFGDTVKLLTADEFLALSKEEREKNYNRLDPEAAFKLLKGNAERGDSISAESVSQLKKIRTNIGNFCTGKKESCFKSQFQAYWKYASGVIALPRSHQTKVILCMDSHKPDYIEGSICFKKVSLEIEKEKKEGPRGIKIHRIYKNKFREPQAMVTVTNITDEAVEGIKVKCTFFDGDIPMGLDTRISTKLVAGESDTIRFWVREEIDADSVKCRVVDIF